MSRRLFASFILVAALVLAALEIPLGIQNARTADRDLESRITRDVVSIATVAEDALEAGVAPPAALVALARDYQHRTGGRVVIVGRSGTAVVDTDPASGSAGNFASRPEFKIALDGKIATGTRGSDTLGYRLLYVAAPVASGGRVHGAVRITYPTSAVDKRVRHYWLLLAAIAGLVLTAVGAAGIILARWLAAPLALVEHAAAEAGRGDLTVRAPVDAGPPEVRSLGRSFNAMVTSIGGLLRAQRDFVADASHELRTPLAALRLRLENLERDVTPQARPGLEGALIEVERLSVLVDDLLALARADARQAAPEPVELRALVAERLAAWEAAAADRGVRLELAAGSPVGARATPGALAQVVDNLLANALTVAPAGTAITFECRAAAGRACLSVEDRGPGLPAAERERAFDRFWRGTVERGPGSGLGLAIVKRLVEADGGTARLEEALGGGLRAVVELTPGPARPAG